MTAEQRQDDYEKSCAYGTQLMRETAIRRGELLPRPENPDEMDWHREWLETTLAQLGRARP